MKKLTGLYPAVFLILIGCQTEMDARRIDVREIETLMHQQQFAWNKGDIPAFMDTYWSSDSLVFIGKRGLTFGWDQTLNNYKKSYPDRSAMGRLEFENKKHEVLGDSAVYTIGKWTLFRSEDTLGGHYTLLWKKINGQWKIVADHTS